MSKERFEFLKKQYPLICEALIEHWGEPCGDFEPNCLVCKVWAEFSALSALSGEEIP